MSLSAVNNPTAFTAYTNYTQNTRALSGTMQSLATGTKSVDDAPAAVGISESLRGTIGGVDKAQSNAEGAMSALETADSWEQKIHDQLGRMKELAVQAQDDTKTNDDRSNLNEEFQELNDEISRMVSTAEFNGKKLINGDTSTAAVNVAGNAGGTIEINLSDVSSFSGVSSLSSDTISTVSQASTAVGDATTAINQLSEERAKIGGQMSRLENTVSGLESAENNLRAAESKFRDVDMAYQSQQQAQQQVMTQVSNAMMAQANQLPNQVMQLLG